MMFQSLLDIVFPPRISELLVRECSPETLYTLLVPIVVETTTPHTVALLPYKEKVVRALIHEAKYHHSKKAYDLLAHVLALYISELVLDRDQLSTDHYVLVAMPLSKERRRFRGYNQVEEVVRRVSVLLAIPYSEVLLKVKDTESQTTLDREARVENQKGVFKALNIEPDGTYILIDDVLTTGATMQSAIQELTDSTIFPITLAH